MQSSRTTITKTITKIKIKCDGCGTEFLISRSKVEASKITGYKIYCNRQCYLQNSKFGHNGDGSNNNNNNRNRSKFLNFYRCRHCDNWIPHNKAIMYTSKTGKMTYPICPNARSDGCIHVRLTITPRTTKCKTKYRELKRQEE